MLITRPSPVERKLQMSQPCFAWLTKLLRLRCLLLREDDLNRMEQSLLMNGDHETASHARRTVSDVETPQSAEQDKFAHSNWLSSSSWAGCEVEVNGGAPRHPRRFTFSKTHTVPCC